MQHYPVFQYVGDLNLVILQPEDTVGQDLCGGRACRCLRFQTGCVHLLLCGCAYLRGFGNDQKSLLCAGASVSVCARASPPPGQGRNPPVWASVSPYMATEHRPFAVTGSGAHTTLLSEQIGQCAAPFKESRCWRSKALRVWARARYVVQVLKRDNLLEELKHFRFKWSPFKSLCFILCNENILITQPLLNRLIIITCHWNWNLQFSLPQPSGLQGLHSSSLFVNAPTPNSS